MKPAHLDEIISALSTWHADKVLLLRPLLEGQTSPLDIPDVLTWATSVRHYPSESLLLWRAVVSTLGLESYAALDQDHGGLVFYAKINRALDVLCYHTAKDKWAILRLPNITGDVW